MYRIHVRRSVCIGLVVFLMLLGLSRSYQRLAVRSVTRAVRQETLSYKCRAIQRLQFASIRTMSAVGDQAHAETGQQNTFSYVFPPPPIPSLPVITSSETEGVQQQQQEQLLFPVNRIYCVGRNYADHCREMGGDPDREPPFFFSKPAQGSMVHCPARKNQQVGKMAEVPYPTTTENLHHEIELVVAIGTRGRDIPVDAASRHVYGYAVGVDLTRRDLQSQAREARLPWDSSKGFDNAAPISSIHHAELAVPQLHKDLMHTPTNCKAQIWLSVEAAAATATASAAPPRRCQEGTLNQMIWSVPEIVSILSQQFTLQPGDLIFTGTPAGVGPLQVGDIVRGGVEGMTEEIEFRVVPLKD